MPNMIKPECYVLICLGIALRGIVSLYSYSGAGTPPLFGDYEAQRHWQEITVNLSPIHWYSNTTQNNLLYWGLDYPPLSAYHSFLMGKVASFINVSYIELHQSKGIETSSHKSFMRSTVLLADVLIFIPSAVFYAFSVGRLFNKDKSSDVVAFKQLVITLLYPGQILIDNGHFQYNNVSIGLTALAIVFILKDSNVLASIYFSLALNYKQMGLYHSIPFFIYLLRKCFTKGRFFNTFLKIGSSVLLTFVSIWSPWIYSIDRIPMVISRIFPLARGVYEEKVANFWCAVNIAIKLK